MIEGLDGSRRKRIRTRVLVDWRFQLALAGPLLGVLVMAAAAYAVAVYLLPGEAALTAMNAEETRRMLLRASAVYFALATAGLGSVALFLSHRIAGPAFVIERALRSLRDGDPGERLSLRPGDSLQELARAARELREHLGEREDRRRGLLQQIAARLDGDDIAGARELLHQLDLPKQPE